MPLKHVPPERMYCKEVVIPDSNGNPVGGLTCKKFSPGSQGPGYEPWSRVDPSGQLAPATPVVLVFQETSTGEFIELTAADINTILTTARKEGWL